MNFVHDDPEFADLLGIVAARHVLEVSIIEKDYWVTHALWALLAQGFEVWFKGGTSLSKGFGLIRRFSEDLDLKVVPGSTDVPAASLWKACASMRCQLEGRFSHSLLTSCGPRISREPA